MNYLHIPNMSPGIDFEIELQQANDEGRDLSSLQAKIEQWRQMPADKEETLAFAADLQREIQTLPLRDCYVYDSPSTWDDIAALSATGSLSPAAMPDSNLLHDKLVAAWLARAVGCTLGQPIEGWRRPKIVEFLKETDNYPIKTYCRSDVGETMRKKYDLVDVPGPYGMNKMSWGNNLEGFFPQDDDTNFTVFALQLMETYGRGLTPDKVLHGWLHRFPLGFLWTAERVAYRNAVIGITPPQSAVHCNPYREWIGAQIRADLYGYICPGNPIEAARLAWTDASISHTANGIYGAMWVAAMLAQAAVSDDIEEIIAVGLSVLPQKSRFVEWLHTVRGWHAEGISAEEAIERVHIDWNEHTKHHWCHTISNAMIVAVALLWGEDIDTLLHIAVTAGFDTDCNAATAASVYGMVHGTAGISDNWLAPLNPNNLSVCEIKISSVIGGKGLYTADELARRCVTLAAE